MNWSMLKPKDFHLYYGVNRLKVDGLSQIDSITYKLHFSRNNKSQRKKVREFFQESGTKKEKPIMFELNNLTDLDGNLLGKENSELLDQFREFFTQKIINGGNNKVDNVLYIDKNLPLDDEKQLNISIKMNEEFWMNTPLKNLSNKEN